MAKSVFGAARDTPLRVKSCPRKLVVGGRGKNWQLLTAPGWGGVGVSEPSGCLGSCTQNFTFSFTRDQALNKSQCGVSPRTFTLEKPGTGEGARGGVAQGEAVGCCSQGNGLEIQAPTHRLLSCLPLLGRMREPPCKMGCCLRIL